MIERPGVEENWPAHPHLTTLHVVNEGEADIKFADLAEHFEHLGKVAL